MTTPKPSLDDLVACSPDVMSGVPVFQGTRVPIKNLIDYLAAGDSLDEFLHQFPTVKRAQATALLVFAEELLLAKVGEAPHR